MKFLFQKSREPVKASYRAQRALGVSPRTTSEITKMSEDAVAKALSVADFQPVPPPPPEAKAKPPIPTDPAGHLRYAERVVEQMEADEAMLTDQIEREKADHASRIAALNEQLAGVRKTRAFYAQAGVMLAPDAEEPRPAPKPRKTRAQRAAEKAESGRRVVARAKELTAEAQAEEARNG